MSADPKAKPSPNEASADQIGASGDASTTIDGRSRRSAGTSATSSAEMNAIARTGARVAVGERATRGAANPQTIRAKKNAAA